MFLPDDVKRIINLLEKASHNAYAVGGCVRDSLMGREVNDYDITTSALPEQVEMVLTGDSIKYIETGLKHGTVTAVINHIPYEITTFRCDGEYRDNRRPESVCFVSDIKEDLSRRDFTVNAIAYNEKEGFVDLFGGREDIENKIIRTVGDADKRFNEDALRIMRALRFASQLGFTIEEQTEKAIFRNKELLRNIAVERIFKELQKIILGENCDEVIGKYIDVIRIVIPEITANQIGELPKKDYLRFAVLLNGSDKKDEVLNFLKVSNEFAKNVKTIAEYYDCEINNDRLQLKKLLGVMGETLLFDLLELKNNEKAVQIVREIIENNEPYKISDLAINGYDLMELGFKGKEISQMLEYLLDEVISNPAKNEKEILIKIAERLRSRKNLRLKNFDYSSNYAVFVTLCTNEMKCILSQINVGAIHESPAKVQLTDIGLIIKLIIDGLDKRFNVSIPNYIIMPNHIHLLIVINNRAIPESPLQSGRSTISKVIGYLKMNASKQIHSMNEDLKVWQRGFYDHIIRDEQDYINHLQYIDENPAKWLLGKDEYYS